MELLRVCGRDVNAGGVHAKTSAGVFFLIYHINTAGLWLYLCTSWLRSRTARRQMATAEHEPFVQAVQQQTKKGTRKSRMGRGRGGEGSRDRLGRCLLK